MIIERIAKKDDNTVVIYLDNGEKLFLSYEVLLKSGLRKGTEISTDRFNYLILQNRKYFIRQKAISLLARRHHSQKELELKLRKKNYEKELIEDVLNSMKDSGLIDDSSFAFQFAEEKLDRKKWGANKIKNELFKRGISTELVHDVINKLASPADQSESAMLAAEKKFKVIVKREKDAQKIKQKVLAHLISRGFSFDIASEAIKKLNIRIDTED
ncbi:MAG: regulatory protein RecX [Ignavibacteriaceae bacterium]